LLKNKITKQNIFDVATKVVQQGLIPTHTLLKLKLGKGSDTTIQKYFKQWKEECFKKAITSLEQNTTKVSQLGITESYEFLEEKRKLEQVINKQIAQNEHYAQELINAEKTNIALKETIHQLQTTNQQSQLELKETKAIKTTLEQVNLEIQTRLDVNNNDLINKQQLLIDELRSELKELNGKSMLALQQTSSSGHELLMQEKLTSMNLQEKINTMSKQLSELHQQLQTVNNKLAAKQQPLLRQLEWQQKIIQNHLGFDKLRQIEEEELKLKFNTGVTYGK